MGLSTLVSFVTDNGYLVPSLVAARQLVGRNIHELADIVIFTVDVDNNTIRELSDSRANSHIKFEPLISRLFVPPPGVVFRKSHITVTALARLCLHEVISPKYENIVYLDGDVQIVGDISPLVRYRVQDESVLAARACAWLSTADGYRNFISKKYLEEIGGVALRRVAPGKPAATRTVLFNKPSASGLILATLLLA